MQQEGEKRQLVKICERPEGEGLNSHDRRNLR